MPDVAGPPVPPGPPDRIMKRLKEGYCLRDCDLDMLNEHGAIAAQLEMSNPDFARDARKWRADWQAAERADAMRDLLAAKKNTYDAVQKKREQDAKAMREAREAREEARRREREAYWQAELDKKNAALRERAEQERRDLVEAAIREALVKESRFTNEATIPFDRSCPVANPDAKDNPGPGHYEPPPLVQRVANFDYHDTDLPRKNLERETSPGPAAYNPPAPTIQGGSFAPRGKTQGEFKGRQRPPAETPGPGPGAFNLRMPRKPGGKISRYLTGRYAPERPSEMTPGPCDYDVDKNSPAGRSQLPYQGATLGARTNLPSQVALLEETRRPGPGTPALSP